MDAHTVEITLKVYLKEMWTVGKGDQHRPAGRGLRGRR
jgi:hypothetical protein